MLQQISRPSQLSSLSHSAQPRILFRNKPHLFRINADNQDKKFMCIFWSIFLVFVIAFAITSKVLPKAIKSISNDTQLSGTNLDHCQNPSVFNQQTVYCGSFSQQNPSVNILVRDLSSLNQFVTFWLEIYPKDISIQISLNQNLTFLIYSLQPVGNGFKMKDIHQNQTISFQYSSLSTNYIYSDDQTIKGYRIFIGFIGSANFPLKTFTLQFSGPFDQFANINTLSISAFKIRKSFTIFTIVLRYVFFALSLLAAFFYNRKYRQIPITDRIIEQKLIEILSVLVVFFNDPFYPITVLKENMVSSFFSMLFVLVFIAYLIFIWMVFFDRILYEQGQKDTQQITKFKIGYSTVLLILLLTLYMLYANYRINDHPLIPSQKLTDTRILTLDTITSVFFAGGIAYIATQYIRICCNKPDRMWRSELMMSYSVLFIVALMIFIFTDNALGSYSYEGANFIFLYGLMNLYVWYLQYMYSPAGEEGERRMINIDERMSIGTVEFNDLNINLDENERWGGLKANQMVGNELKQVGGGWGKEVRRDDGTSSEQEHQERNFSIEDDNETDYPQNNMKSPQNYPHTQQIDFFNQQAINKLSSNRSNKPKIQQQTNLLQTTVNGPTKNPSRSIEPSQEVDQNQLQILSQMASQQPSENLIKDQQNFIDNGFINNFHQDNKTQKKKEEGFGQFQLE